MSPHLHIEKAGPGLSVQDLGRPGHLATGLSCGGAADRLALFEAAALLGAKQVLAGIEMAGMGGQFGVTAATRFALTGAPMAAQLDGTPIAWHASHVIWPGQVLTIGGAKTGIYGYLTPAGGMATQLLLGSRASHLAVGIGSALKAGDRLPIGADPNQDAAASKITVADRFCGGSVRLMPGPQTALFSDDTLEAFFATTFTRSPIGNRQGARFECDRQFSATTTSLASELILPGDIQLTGDGVPYVLLAECQTTGGYPRIGSVIGADLAKIAQTPPGATLRFERLTLPGADQLYRPEAGLIATLARTVSPLVRDPHDIADLLSYQLISGAIAEGD